MKYIVLLSISIFAIGCTGQPDSDTRRQDSRQAIELLSERHVQAALSEDVEAFLATVTDDFALMPPNNPGARGKDAVRAWFEGFFGAFSIESLEFPSTDLVVDRDWAFQHYTYDWTVVPDSGGDPIWDKGDGIYIYHRDGDGSWKIAHDIWTSSEPLTGTANAQPLNKDNFREYLDALESVDTEALTTRFYHEDFSMDIGEDTLDLAGFLEYEKSLSSLVDFHFEVDQIVADESGIAIDAIETFVVLKDADVPFIGPARKGERWDLHLTVFYTLADGKISTIKANVLSAQKIE